MKQKIIAPIDGGLNKKDPSWLIKDKFWTDGNNVHFGAGYVEKVGGWNKWLNEKTAWAASVAYLEGDVVRPATDNYHAYQCTTPGTSGGTAPAKVLACGAGVM